MIELRVLQGNLAGERLSSRHLPVKIGRKPYCDLVLEDVGVWDEHLEISYDPASGFYVTSLSEGSLIVNQHPVESAVLKNGDKITLGSAKLQFWLTPAVQKRFQITEWTLWIALLALCGGQLALIRWLN